MGEISQKYFDNNPLLREFAYSLFSATTPFLFATTFGILPQFAQSRYVLIYNAADKTFQMFWAAFITDTPTPDFHVGPYYVSILSDKIEKKTIDSDKIKFTNKAHANSESAISKWIDNYFREEFGMA